MSKKNAFSKSFHNSIDNSIIDFNIYNNNVLDEGKFSDFVKKHVGPVSAGLALSLSPMQSDAAETSKQPPTTATTSIPSAKPKITSRESFVGNDMLIIAKTLYAEARGEGDIGMRCVASVIYNRAKGDKNKYASECLKPYQFSCWNGKKDIAVDTKSNSYKLALQIAKEMMFDKFQPLGFTNVKYPKFYCTKKLFFSDSVLTSKRLKYIADVRKNGVYGIYKNHVFYNPVQTTKTSVKSKK